MGGHVENSNLLRLGSSNTWKNRYFLINDSLYLNSRINKLSEILSFTFKKKFFIKRNILFSHLVLNFSCNRYSVSYYIYDPVYEQVFTKIFGRKTTKVLIRFYAKSLMYGKDRKYRFYKEIRGFGSRKYFSNLKKFSYLNNKVSKYKILQEFNDLNKKKFSAFLILVFISLNISKAFDEVYVNKKPRQSFPILLLTKLTLLNPIRAEVYNYTIYKTIARLNKYLIGASLGSCISTNKWKENLNIIYQRYHKRKGIKNSRCYQMIYRFQKQKTDYNIFFFNLDQTSFTARLLVRHIILNLKRKFRIAEILFPMLRMISPYISGFKIIFSGRFNRAPRAHYKINQLGKVPLNSFWYKIDYSLGHIPLKFGDCSVRVWVSRFFGMRRQFSKTKKLAYYVNNYGSLKPYYLNKKIENVDNFMIKHPFDLF